MSYLEEFRKRISREDYPGFLSLWEEYCAGDEVDGRELKLILAEIKDSRFAHRFGEYAETALPMWEKVEGTEDGRAIVRLVLDLQTSNSAELADFTHTLLEKLHGNEESFDEKIRLVGLRRGQNFQGAIRNFELLSHLNVGKYVFHTGGWGTGEIESISPIREEIVLEFECVPGKKTLSFDNAFKNLNPLDDDHFLARRFGDPDALEAQARKDPVGVIHLLLKDLGPKTAAEIKDELCELVIPEPDWTKWWQSARSRIKKDTLVETPNSLREPFRLREEEVSHSEQLKVALQNQDDHDEVLLLIYNFLRDFPEVQRNEESKAFIKEKLDQIAASESLAHRLQVHALFIDFLGEKSEPALIQMIKEVDDVPGLVDAIAITALKKRVLVLVRQKRSDWTSHFLHLFETVKQSSLRDYLLKQLDTDEARPGLIERLENLLSHPSGNPPLFVWYFQKVADGSKDIPYSDKEGRFRFFEGFLTLLARIELQPEYRELVKRMYGLIIASRYEMIREFLKESSHEFAQEFLLLISKCHTFTEHDVSVLRSLAEVVHPSLGSGQIETQDDDDRIVWTTEEGFETVRKRIHYIGTVETIDNAKEIEKARELGDLRENAEYKAAQERRHRLQSELKMLSEQMNRARVITSADIIAGEVGVGCIVELDKGGAKIAYTLLGPWDADPENQVLSVQSRFAKAMKGLTVGDTFTFQGDEYTIRSIKSYLDDKVTA